MCHESIRSEKASPLVSEAALRLIFENFPHRLSNRLDRRLTLGDIAAAAGVSVRSLQFGFQQFRGTTPLAHLRPIHLKAAHAELSPLLTHHLELG